MSGKKNKKPFSEDEDKDDIGFRVPSTPLENEDLEKEAETEDDLDLKDEDGLEDDEEEDLDDEERGWHTFDMDNPDESL